ncbi:hypothetical protein GDO81_016457 [Engystomops pustulosus]|uniref:Uncharacterized protein n=1 Tax=Engystomops pustulosus TaxID=76066 RepID=A0AAV7AS72_ENGPU|nr:hypothetical protein GDO81_016457 [Engystomops pustulosus]
MMSLQTSSGFNPGIRVPWRTVQKHSSRSPEILSSLHGLQRLLFHQGLLH